MQNTIMTVNNLVKSYKNNEVIHNVSFEIEKNKIYGLIGRNGAGKTTLLSAITAQLRSDGGEIKYCGEDVWENQNALSNICFSRELSAMNLFGQNTMKGKDYLKAGEIYYKNWDKKYADKLVKLFGLDVKKPITRMSKGMMSMVTIIVALASKAPLTILDEPVAGLDVVAREQFYNLLLEEYSNTGRTFIVSTHIIDEATNIFEDIIFIDKGNIIEMGNTEEFISEFKLIGGLAEDVDSVSKNQNIIHSETRGRAKTVCVRTTDTDFEDICEENNVTVSGITLQKAFVYMTVNTAEADNND